jgi:diamine N-acetyltransferase
VSADYTIRTITKADLYLIRDLWDKLRKIHLKDSHFFKEHFRTFTWEKRSDKFIKTAEEDIFIQLVENDKVEKIGYCVATVDNGTGEIDSIYLEEEYRKHGIGAQLLNNGVACLKEKGCETIVLGVAEGHEAVFEFYEKYGFYPRKTILQLKSK